MREDIQLSLAEVQMPRTRYQLEHFVIGAHDTPEMQFVQVCRELEALHYTIKEVAMQVRKTEYEIEDLREKGDRISQVEADIKELGLEWFDYLSPPIKSPFPHSNAPSDTMQTFLLLGRSFQKPTV